MAGKREQASSRIESLQKCIIQFLLNISLSRNNFTITNIEKQNKYVQYIKNNKLFNFMDRYRKIKINFLFNDDSSSLFNNIFIISTYNLTEYYPQEYCCILSRLIRKSNKSIEFADIRLEEVENVGNEIAVGRCQVYSGFFFFIALVCSFLSLSLSLQSLFDRFISLTLVHARRKCQVGGAISTAAISARWPMPESNRPSVRHFPTRFWFKIN